LKVPLCLAGDGSFATTGDDPDRQPGRM